MHSLTDDILGPHSRRSARATNTLLPPTAREVLETLADALPDVVRRMQPGDSLTIERKADGDITPIVLTFKSPTRLSTSPSHY
jgi:hypothetical protein